MFETVKRQLVWGFKFEASVLLNRRNRKI